MKRCPECRRDYFDESLLYCLDDGTALLLGPVSAQFDATAVLPYFDHFNDVQTRVFSSADSQASIAENTIAVLPFLNISADQSGDYFSDGLSEELLNVLSRIRGLRVAARTSAFAFKGKSITVAEIGRILNVAFVLEGSIRQAGERVRISVQLIKVEDGFQLWSETYDRTMDDIFAVQDDIAQSVVEELRVRLVGSDQKIAIAEEVVSEVAVAIKGRADDPEAQRLMLLGRFFLDKTTQDDTKKAIACFNEALAIDPEFAHCWAELGRAYSIEVGKGWTPIEEGFNASRKATLRALALEPNLAEGHAQLGRIQVVYDWDFAGAEASYRKALELAPGSSSVIDGASILAYKLGRTDESLELSRKVLVQDPLSAAFWHNLGLACHAADLLDESERAFRRALELAPHRFVTNALLALVLMDGGRMDEAFTQADLEQDEFWRMWALAILNNVAGRDDDSAAALQTILNESAVGNEYQIAEIYTVRGDTDKAFDWLEKAIAVRDPGVTHAKANPRFRPLKEDPRWSPLLARMGFTESN
ncbi:MAG: tetratricopeptide repeat protein [Acidobacteriota bacterium]